MLDRIAGQDLSIERHMGARAASAGGDESPGRQAPKKAMVRNSMLSRGGVPGGVAGSSKPV